MVLWVILFLGLLIWARFGATGLEAAATVGAMILAGLGVRSFLNTFWKKQACEEKDDKATNVWERPRDNKYRRGLFYARAEDLRREVR